MVPVFYNIGKRFGREAFDSVEPLHGSFANFGNQSLHIIRVQMTDLEKSWDSNSNLLHNFSRSFDNDWFP